MSDRLTPPFKIRSTDDALWLEDANGLRFGYTYVRRPGTTAMDRPTRETAERFVKWLARTATAAADKGKDQP